MKPPRLLGPCLTLWLALSVLPAPAQPAGSRAIELLRIRLVNEQNGAISVSSDQGATWSQVGCVLRYTTQVTREGYTASKWVPAGQVAATAVNAIHINVGYNAQDDRGVVPVFHRGPKEREFN